MSQAQGTVGAWTLIVLVLALALCFVSRFVHQWRDGELGTPCLLVAACLMSILPVLVFSHPPVPEVRWLALGSGALLLGLLVMVLFRSRQHKCGGDRGLGNATMLGGAGAVLCAALFGMAHVLANLPDMVEAGLQPPKWIADYHWAKPSIMLMGFWAAIGSNNMLLYIAGLSGVPQELYEAADIDGAGPLQRFWNVTWPQLSNVTFFILIMSVIGGLQGGFEMARTMTQGGPAGATTTLSYYVYSEGFATGRLGYASAVAWALFALVFLVTIFNWKFGSRYMNE